MFKLAFAAALLTTQAGPAIAQITFDQPAAATSLSSAQSKSSGKLVCEREETLGSRLQAKKVCLTAEQWREQKERMREQLEKFQQQNTSVGTPSGSI